MIVCLGWGSLVWSPGDLLVEGDWQTNGPEIPIEFARQSNDGRLTLVVEESAIPVRTMWIRMGHARIDEAAENLRKREGTVDRHIGRWSKKSANSSCPEAIVRWASSMSVEGVVWTALPPKFGDKNGVVPTAEEAVAYLKGLESTKATRAEEYVRRTPMQIRTAYRQHFEDHLGWVGDGAT